MKKFNTSYIGTDLQSVNSLDGPVGSHLDLGLSRLADIDEPTSKKFSKESE